MLGVWTAFRWSPAWIAAALFALSAIAVFLLAARPAIEVHETHLKIGRRAIPWSEIRRVDQAGWNVPLAVRLTLAGGSRVLLVHPGDPNSCISLLRHLQRYSRKQSAPPRYPLLRPEDEEEVERLFQRLKSVGRL